MTEKITLELTLEELKLLDNSIGRYNHTAVLKDKIKDAYPLPEMKFVIGGKFEIVSYNDKNYCRYEWDDGSHSWYKKVYPDEGVLMVAIIDKETERLLEGLWFNEVKCGKYD